MINRRGLLIVAAVAALWLSVGYANAKPLDLTQFTTVNHAKSGISKDGVCRVVSNRKSKVVDLEKHCPLRPAQKAKPAAAPVPAGVTWWGM